MSYSDDIFQSTHPVWGETDDTRFGALDLYTFQSTHPVWGETADIVVTDDIVNLFQSTHPVWGETINQSSAGESPFNFNPLTPCGVRREQSRGALVQNQFQSTHPVWGETTQTITQQQRAIFQSTHPVWGETRRRSG